MYRVATDRAASHAYLITIGSCHDGRNLPQVGQHLIEQSMDALHTLQPGLCFPNAFCFDAERDVLRPNQTVVTLGKLLFQHLCIFHTHIVKRVVLRLDLDYLVVLAHIALVVDERQLKADTGMRIRSDFRKWFPRMCQYGFIEGRDYEYMPRVRLQDEGGRTVQRYVKDYRITQDMAKKLCKLHHTAVSAAYHPQPFDWDSLLGLLHKKPPRRSSYEAQLSESDSLVTTTQIAKEYGCGAKVFNRLLHLHGIQYRANGQWVLYSEHHGKGYTSSLTFRLQRSDGSEVEKLHTAWTQKGRKFLYHTLKRRGVLPLAEQGG